ERAIELTGTDLPLVLAHAEGLRNLPLDHTALRRRYGALEHHVPRAGDHEVDLAVLPRRQLRSGGKHRPVRVDRGLVFRAQQLWSLGYARNDDRPLPLQFADCHAVDPGEGPGLVRHASVEVDIRRPCRLAAPPAVPIGLHREGTRRARDDLPVTTL